MLTRGRYSIRTKLILVYLLVAIPLIVLLAISFYNRYQADQDAVLNERFEVARLAASNFRLFISQTVLAETIIGDTIIGRELDPEEASAYLSRTVRAHPASNIAFLDNNGIIVAASLTDLIGQDRSNHPTIRAILEGDDSAIGNLERDANNSPVFIIAARITENRLITGIVSMSIEAENLDDVLDIGVRLGGVNIVDSSGRLVFQSQVQEIPFDERDWSDEQFVREALAGRTFSSTGLVFPLDGSFRMGVEIPIQNIGWATGSFAPVETALAPVRRAAILNSLLALAILFISLLVAFILGSRLIGSLIILKNRMRATRQTGFTERVTITTGDEIEDLANSFNLMQEEILAAQAEQKRLQGELEERNRELSILYEQQKNVASVLQESLLPVIAPRIDHLEIGLKFQSATEAALVGGDFFDFIEISDDTFGIVIGDVSGKGLEAATLTTTIRNTLRAFAYDESSPARTMEKVNRIAVIETPPSIFVTLFYGIFDADTYNLTYANAGHWPPTVFNPADGSFEDLGIGGLPLGVFPNVAYTEHSTKLAPGSITTLYTDGVVESKMGGELFGVSRLQKVIRESAGLPPGEIANTIIEEAKALGGGKLYDDAAVMVIKAIT
ncbi:MAG: SpoIIE family protein phosphatase [Actinobacteria bacterium]|nr:SpoIIE family protein phosphatase [Actinomycetota bacterium]